MLTACVPGGRIVDPQVVADNIRAWVADHNPAELANASVVEQIAQQWDGCQYDAPGEMVDIGAAIRRAGKRLSAKLAEQQGVGELHAELLARAENLERMAAGDRETGESIEQAVESGEGYTPDDAVDVAAGLQHGANSAEETAALLRKAASALAATGKQQVGDAVTDQMVEAALQSTVAEPNVGTPWREVVALDDHADFIADMRKAIQAAISVQPDTPDFSPATQAVADHCDRIFWRHNYYTLPLGPSDRAKPTRRRQSAVELVQKLGFQWKDEAWVQVGEVQGDARAQFEAWMTNTAKIIVGSSDPYPAGLERDYWRVWQAALAARQPGAQALGWSGWATQKPGHMPKLWGTREIAELNHDLTGDARLIFLSEQPAQGIDVGQVHAAVDSLLEFADHHEICGDTDAYNNAEFETCGCGFDSAREAIWNALDGQRDAAPGVGNG